MQRCTGHRHSVRLYGYNYARAGAYFITLCTYDRERLFGDVIDGHMHLSEFGQIVDDEWRKSQDLRTEIVLDACVVMPNHIHGIVLMRGREDVGAHGVRPQARLSRSLG